MFDPSVPSRRRSALEPSIGRTRALAARVREGARRAPFGRPLALCLLAGALVTCVAARLPLLQAQAQPAVGTWRHHTCGDCVVSLALGDDAVWAGTMSAGLIRHDRAAGTVRQYTVEDGLPGRAIADVDIAPDGGLWVATFDSGWTGNSSGLAYWDGNDWHHRGLVEAVSHILGTQVVALDGGRAMARVEDGVAYYDGQAWIRQDGQHGLIPAEVRRIARDSNGSAYVTTSAGVARHDGQSWHTEDTDSLPSPDLRWLAFGPDDSLWVEGPDFLARSAAPASPAAGRSWSLYPLPPNLSRDPSANPTLLAGVDPSDRPWAIHDVAYILEGGTWVQRDLVAELGLPAGVVRIGGPLGSTPAIAFEQHDGIWAGQIPTGLWSFDGGSWSHHPSRIGPSNLIGFSVKVAPDDQVWLGHMPLLHPDRLLDRYDGQAWTHVGQAEGLPIGGTLGVMQSNLDIDREGRVWLASDGGEEFDSWLAWKSDTSWAHANLVELGIGIARVVTADDRGGVWLGSNHGVAYFDPSSGDVLRLTTEEGLPSDAVWAIAVDHRQAEERVWIGTEGGLARFEGGRVTRFTGVDGLGMDSVGAIVVDETRDALWLASSVGRPSVVSRLDADGWTVYDQDHGLAGDGFWSLELGPDGRPWGAISDPSDEHSGLARFDGAGWTILQEKDGLLSNSAFDVAVDAQGTVWVGSISGLSELRPAEVAPTTPSPSPNPDPTATTPPPSPTPEAGCVCRAARERAPAALISAILADPDQLGGHGQPRDPNKPPGPFNPPRVCLGIHNAGTAYHPLFNPLAWKAGCP